MRRWTRKTWTANRADPTAITEWAWNKRRGAWVTLVLRDVTWGLETKLTVFGRTWRTWDNPLFLRVFDALETRETERLAGLEDDPMGRMSDYE